MLGMYDMPALQAAHDRFWNLIRDDLSFGPDRLTRDHNMWDVWQDPGLILAQTCGMPYRTRLHGQVQLVGTPDYDLPDCPAGYYNSVFVTRRDDTRDLKDLADGTFAYNEALSQSGWAAPIAHMKLMNLRPAILMETGGHALSAQAVAIGNADYAALDALTWHLLQEHTDLGEHLKGLTGTSPTPALPYITAQGQDAARIARAVRAAIDGLEEGDRQQLHLRGLIDIPPADYLSVPNPPTPKALHSVS